MHEPPLLSAAACAIADTDDGRTLQARNAEQKRRNRAPFHTEASVPQVQPQPELFPLEPVFETPLPVFSVLFPSVQPQPQFEFVF